MRVRVNYGTVPRGKTFCHIAGALLGKYRSVHKSHVANDEGLFVARVGVPLAFQLGAGVTDLRDDLRGGVGNQLVVGED